MPEQGVSSTIDGKPVLENGKPPQFKADSIALSPDGEYLYYKAITAKSLYRIKTEILRGDQDDGKTSSGVEEVGEIFPADGFWMDRKANLYLSDVQRGNVREHPMAGWKQVVSGPRLQWPDTFSEGPDGAIYSPHRTSTSHRVTTKKKALEPLPTASLSSNPDGLAYAVLKHRPGRELKYSACARGPWTFLDGR